MLKMQYQERLDRLEQTLPEKLLTRLEDEVAGMLAAETVDFSFLMPQMQYTYVKDLRDGSFRADVASLNGETLQALKEAIAGKRKPEGAQSLREVDARFGHAAYGERLRRIFSSFDSPAGEETQERRRGEGKEKKGSEEHFQDTVQEALVEEFATLERLRLLFS
jgi:hypothetical protein